MDSSSENSHKADILVVDDTPDNIRLLSKMLIEQGYNVRKALNGPMALVAVGMTAPDLILLDITMPELNGYEVCRQIKQNPETCAIPIIFLSALDDAMDKVKAFQFGGTDYITKPFYLEEVLARIENQLMIKRLQAQLQAQNKELHQALTELKATQTQLIQKEKMIALGQLVAGISHEINNPISFIAGNLAYAQRYIQSLLNLIEQYQQEYPNPTPSIQKTIETIDLKFIWTDLMKLMKSMHVGVGRIQSIILALRIFSHLGESNVKSIDLHQEIDNTLLLLQHRLNEKIKVDKEYGNLPSVTCYASQINQVFLNLLNNAIDALGRKMEQDGLTSPTIWIRTTVTAYQTVKISIQDNGPGIAEEARSRLFDPFFSTKPVGKGVGLGLATSYQIVVDQHSGRLSCESELGQGAVFILELPIYQPAFEQGTLPTPTTPVT